MTTRVIRDEREWDALRPSWDALVSTIPGAPPALDFVWLREWWQVFGRTYGAGGLRIITAWRGSALVAILPLYVEAHSCGGTAMRVLRFISTGEAEHEETCPEYLDLICLPDDCRDAVGAMWQEADRMDWDQLEWLDLPAASPLLQAGATPPGACVFDRGTCPVADLSNGFEAYLGRLSPNGRQQARRLMRDAERAGARFELAAPDQASGTFDAMVRLHQERWRDAGQPGAFGAPRFVEFHRRLIDAWLPGRRAVLARLWLADELLAVHYGFISGATFAFYQSGARYNREGPLRSPGHLCHLLLMHALAGQGVTAYDFLRGASSYKDRLATRENRLSGIRIWRASPRALALRAQRVAARVVSRYRRRGSGATP